MSRNASKSTRRRGRRGHRRHTLSRNRRKTFRSKYMIGNGGVCSTSMKQILARDLDIKNLEPIMSSTDTNISFHKTAPQGGTCRKDIRNIYYDPEYGNFYIHTYDNEYYHVGDLINSHRGAISINFSIQDIKSEYIERSH